MPGFTNVNALGLSPDQMKLMLQSPEGQQQLATLMAQQFSPENADQLFAGLTPVPNAMPGGNAATAPFVPQQENSSPLGDLANFLPGTEAFASFMPQEGAAQDPLGSALANLAGAFPQEQPLNIPFASVGSPSVPGSSFTPSTQASDASMKLIEMMMKQRQGVPNLGTVIANKQVV